MGHPHNTAMLELSLLKMPELRGTGSPSRTRTALCEVSRYAYAVDVLRKSICCHFSSPGRFCLSDALHRFMRLFHLSAA
jgi:hypothetical protein